MLKAGIKTRFFYLTYLKIRSKLSLYFENIEPSQKKINLNYSLCIQSAVRARNGAVRIQRLFFTRSIYMENLETATRLSTNTMSTKEFADSLHTTVKTVLDNAKKCLPNKVIMNGIKTVWNENEQNIICQQLSINPYSGKTFTMPLSSTHRYGKAGTVGLSTNQVAKQLGTTHDVVLENARKCLPNKIIKNGTPTVWTEAEITVVFDYMKHHTSNNRSKSLTDSLDKTSTSLTPALKIKKAMALMQEGYEEELERIKQEKKILQIENKELQIQLDEDKDWYSIKRMEKLNPGKKFSYILLKKESVIMNKNVKKVFDANYGIVNAYHISVWESLYFDTLTYNE